MTLLDTHARQHMLQSQILTGHVLDSRVLDALMAVDRTQFVPAALRASAYVDDEIPLSPGRYLLEPLAFARMLKFAALMPHETVMDIGSATGYSSAVLCRLALKVVAVEEDGALMAQAKKNLGDCGNIQLLQSPLREGAPSQGPFDAILIEGAIELLPTVFTDQLREGGRLICVEHDAPQKVAASGLGKLVEYKKVRGTLYKTTLHDASVPLLKAFARPARFAL